VCVLLDEKGQQSFSKLSVFAHETLHMLHHPDLDEPWQLFEPMAIIEQNLHKRKAIQEALISHNMRPKDIVVRVMYQSDAWQPRVDFPRPSMASKGESKYTLEWIAKAFTGLFAAQLRASGAKSHLIVNSIIRKHLLTGQIRPVRGWMKAGADCFENRHVVLICPLPDGGRIVKVAFNV
jgi:hypothetical protein